MDARSLLERQFDDAGYQLNMALEGIAESAMDVKATPAAMSPRETLAHLCECYVAAATVAKGEKHDWGSYRAESLDTGPLKSNFEKLRAEACQAVSALPDDQLFVGNEYIIAHDYYHVGQLCLARLTADPNWDGYSIYRH